MPDKDDLSKIEFAKIDFDGRGPRLGDVQLLANTVLGFQVLPFDRLEALLADAFGRRFDAKRLTPGLTRICQAMNANDLALAAIATRFLPPLRSPAESSATLRKASPDDPIRPGWPAGTPDHKGGEFRPKEGITVAESAERGVEERAKRLARLRARRTFRSLLRRALTTKRLVRLLGEFLGDLIPGDVVADVATVADLTLMAEEMATETEAADAAIAFVEKGPLALEDLMVDGEAAAFPSYSSFLKTDVEKRYGPAGRGYEYHHIVEQAAQGAGVTRDAINSTTNIIRLPKLLHEEVSAFYSSKIEGLTGPQTFREFLRGKSFAEQQRLGRKALQAVGVLR